jgi:hypothetical protein
MTLALGFSSRQYGIGLSEEVGERFILRRVVVSIVHEGDLPTQQILVHMSRKVARETQPKLLTSMQEAQSSDIAQRTILFQTHPPSDCSCSRLITLHIFCFRSESGRARLALFCRALRGS